MSFPSVPIRTIELKGSTRDPGCDLGEKGNLIGPNDGSPLSIAFQSS
jgi:hypothetical protein